MNDSRVQELLDRWSENLSKGTLLSVEDLCQNCPELKTQVSEKVTVLRRFQKACIPAEEEPTQSTKASLVGDTSIDTLSQPVPMGKDAPALPMEIGSFIPEKILGEGGMGTVYLALDKKLGRKVAVKVMKKEIAVHPPARDRFLREARAMAAIEHENIMAILSVGEEDEMPFLVMPVLKGETLQDRMTREGKLPLAEACRIGREIAIGLAAAHERGLIHRDIKPSNIWLQTHGSQGMQSRVKILDFGLARAVEVGDQNVSSSGSIVGTPSYMAPEQASAQAVGPHSDLFSLGCVLYQMVTGSRPFQGPTLMAVLLSLASDHPTLARIHRPETPEALSGLIDRLLQKAPANRPASAEQVATELAKIEADLSSSTVSPKPRKSWSSFGIVALAAGFLLLLTAMAVYQLVFRTSDGNLIVDVSDKETEVRFKDGSLEIFDAKGELKYTLKPSEKNRTLPPGEYKITVAGADGLKVDTPEFTMAKGKDQKVRVYFEPRKIASKAKEEKPPAQAEGVRYGLEFDGKASFVDIPSLQYDGGPVTVEAMVRIPAASTGGLVVSHVGPKASTFLWHAHHNTLGFTRIATNSQVAKAGSITIDASLHHWCGVYDGKRTTFYLDGKRPSQDFVEPEKHGGGGGTHLGFNFAGIIEQVRISKGARYRENFIPAREFAKDEQTLALYQFREGQGTVLNDTSGNTHHGTILEAKWVKLPGSPGDPDRKAAEWVLSVGGEVNVNDSKIAAIKYIAGLPNGKFRLTWISLKENKQINDSALAIFKDCQHLKTIRLENVPIGDDGIAHIQNSKDVQALFLGETQVTDAGLALFKDCKNLTALSLNKTKVTDTGLAHLKDRKELVYLNLAETQVTDAGLVYFKDCTKLRFLYLIGTNVTDTGLENFKNCKDLILFDLDSCRQLTDKSAAFLKDNKNLADLHLARTQVTDAGLAHFKEALRVL